MVSKKISNIHFTQFTRARTSLNLRKGCRIIPAEVSRQIQTGSGQWVTLPDWRVTDLGSQQCLDGAAIGRTFNLMAV